jgi:hypothetical protein
MAGEHVCQVRHAACLLSSAVKNLAGGQRWKTGSWPGLDAHGSGACAPGASHACCIALKGKSVLWGW